MNCLYIGFCIACTRCPSDLWVYNLTGLKVPDGSLMNCVGRRYWKCRECIWAGQDCLLLVHITRWFVDFFEMLTNHIHGATAPACQRECRRSRCGWRSRRAGCRPGECSPGAIVYTKLLRSGWVWCQLPTQARQRRSPFLSLRSIKSLRNGESPSELSRNKISIRGVAPVESVIEMFPTDEPLVPSSLKELLSPEDWNPSDLITPSWWRW